MRRAGFFCLMWAASLVSNAAEIPEKSSAISQQAASVKPAANVDLKEVVSEPLVPMASPEATEPGSLPTTEPDEEGSTAVSSDTLDTPPTAVVPRKGPPMPATNGLAPEESTEVIAEEDETSHHPLVLLKSEVLPGITTRLGWSPSVSFMGISAPTAVLVLNGVKPGPTLCLTAAIHGDELNGIEIVRRVLYNIDPQELSGSIIGVPIVNLEGFRAGSRYLSDRRDLNRFFPGNPEGSSASRIAYSFFHEVVSHCDMLIDLHTGSFRRTNLPQLRADLNYPEVADLSRKMGAIVVVQSEGAEGSLRRAATENGIPAVTLEAGAPHELDKGAVEIGVKSVESALDGLGLISRRSFWQRAEEPVYYQSTWVRSDEGGILLSEVELGQSVKHGELLGAVTDPITNQRYEILSPYDGRVIGMALNQVMHPGFAAYHIGIKAPVSDTPKKQASQGIDITGGVATVSSTVGDASSTDNDEDPADEVNEVVDITSTLSEPGEVSDE